MILNNEIFSKYKNNFLIILVLENIVGRYLYVLIIECIIKSICLYIYIYI